MLSWYINDRYPDAKQMLGIIPMLLSEYDLAPAWEQLRESLGRWNPEPPGLWTLAEDNALIHTGLPPVMPVATAMLRSERILIYPADWLVIVQPSGEYTVARLV